MSSFFFIANSGGHFLHQTRRIGIVHRSQHIGRRFFTDTQPITESAFGIHFRKGRFLKYVLAFAFCFQKLHKFLHLGPMRFDDFGIAVRPENLVRINNSRFHPARRIGIGDAYRRGRRVNGIGTVGELSVVQINHPFGPKGCNVVVERGAFDVGLGVARPAQTLIALRAVGRNFQIIRLLRPDDVVVQLIHKSIVGFKRSCFGRSRRQHNTQNILHSDGILQAFDLYVLKTVIGKTWLVEFAVGIAFGNVQIGSPRFAQVFGHEFAVGIEHFTESKQNGIALGGFEANFDSARKVLPHINQIGIRAHLFSVFGRQPRHFPHRVTGIDLKRSVGFLRNGNDFFPSRVIIIWLIPARQFFVGVVNFPVQNIRFYDWAVIGFPRIVGRHCFLLAVGVFNFQLCFQRRYIAVKVFHNGIPDQQGIAQIPGIPTVRNHGTQGIFAGAQFFTYVKGLVIKAFVVVGPARSEVIVSDFSTVNLKFI